MVGPLESLFPNLQGSRYQSTSPADQLYNCIAWAAGETHRWWWPDHARRRYWPSGALRVETLAAFQEAFATLGYVPCADEGLEAGFEKVALFADAKGIPLHAARQRPGGLWTSKLGEREDIEHSL